MFFTASTTPSLISILVIGLLFSVKPSAAGVGEMKMRFGFNLLPRQATGNLQVCTSVALVRPRRLVMGVPKRIEIQKRMSKDKGLSVKGIEDTGKETS
jgi:hypothetical protein